ncbi:hypothetical protein ACE6H2_025447 [Prunus campanulata]
MEMAFMALLYATRFVLVLMTAMMTTIQTMTTLRQHALNGTDDVPNYDYAPAACTEWDGDDDDDYPDYDFAPAA